MSDSKKPVLPEHPDDALRWRKPPEVAGGWGSLKSTMAYTARKMGVVSGTRALLKVNRDSGFDCPGCAWPDPAKPGVGEFCENGARAVADEACRERVDAAFFAEHDIASMRGQTGHWLNKQGRLVEPMVLREGTTHYTPISWDDAFALIGETLKGLDHPNQAIFYTSGRTSNEAAFLYQLLVRRFGTNNLPDCSNMCHESSGTGLSEVIGVGKGTVQLEDFDHADVILVIGQNPGTNHPRMLTALQDAARRGATIVSINPLREASLGRFKHPKEIHRLLGKGTAIAGMHVPVRLNGDVALLKGIMRALLDEDDARRERGEEGCIQRDFIATYTDGFAALEADLRSLDWTRVCDDTGIDEPTIRKIAQRLAGTEKIIACWAMGLTQHVNGVANVQSVVNLLLMRGAIGQRGAGACPVRGHSNVQGDRTMGIWERPKDAFLDKLAERFQFSPPREHGHDTVAAIEAMHQGEAKIFIGMGGNFVSATPDTALTADALARCDLTVHVSTHLNRSHLTHGRQALILPCLGRTERDLQASGPQFVTVENSMGIVHRSKGILEPASNHLLSEPVIVARIAAATFGSDPKIPWLDLVEDYDRIREHIEATIPGFDDYNTRVRKAGGFALPNPVRDTRQFNTATSKARFTVHPLPVHTLADDELLMMTVRSHDQYNTTVYDLNDRYRGIHHGRRVILMNPTDIEARSLEPGQRVTLTSLYDGVVRRVENFTVIPYEIPPRNAATYFPEANALIPVQHIAHRSRTPASKSVRIRVVG